MAQSFPNREVVRGALTLTVSPEVALAAPGEPYHHGALLPAAFQGPFEGHVVSTLLLHALKEESALTLRLPPPGLGLFGSSPPPVEGPGYCPN